MKGLDRPEVDLYDKEKSATSENLSQADPRSPDGGVVVAYESACAREGRPQRPRGAFRPSVFPSHQSIA